jgi:prevent-host-death family protein
MGRIFSATEARIRFGELMQVAQDGPVIVERDGKPMVVVLSKRDYDRLLTSARTTGWRELVDQAHELIRKGPVKRPVPHPANVLEEIREQRDEQYDLH